MRIKPYPKYKPSGVEWLGDVPERWSVLKIKFLAPKIGSGKTPLGGNEVYVDQGILFLRSQNVYDDGLRLDDAVYISQEVDNAMIASRVIPGDILLNITGASIGRTCLVPAAFVPANVNQHVCIIRLLEREQSKFVALALKSQQTKFQISSGQNGAARDGLNFEQLGSMRIAMPDCQQERDAITFFLDRETAKIDTLIGKQEKLIELLKEKRLAVISHAVTKGLNPNAPMKDSGAEWLGEVPKHWEHPKIGYVGEVRNGSTPDRSNPDYWGGELPWLASGKVNDLIIKNAEEFITQTATDSTSISIFPSGTILVGLVGQGRTRGMAAMLTFPAYINQNVAGIIVKQQADPKYLLFVLCAGYQALRDLGRGGQQDALNCEILAAFRIPLPPGDEQESIVAYLEKTTKKIDTLIAKAEQAIVLQKEHRAALISAAVTGKIDVRNEASEREAA